jgi:hypothetical protein
VRVYNVMGAITADGATRDDTNVVGPSSFWADTLLRYQSELGFDAFLFWPVGADPREQAELFAETVAPAVRAGLGRDISV